MPASLAGLEHLLHLCHSQVTLLQALRGCCALQRVQQLASAHVQGPHHPAASLQGLDSAQLHGLKHPAAGLQGLEAAHLQELDQSAHPAQRAAAGLSRCPPSGAARRGT